MHDKQQIFRAYLTRRLTSWAQVLFIGGTYQQPQLTCDGKTTCHSFNTVNCYSLVEHTDRCRWHLMKDHLPLITANSRAVHLLLECFVNFCCHFHAYKSHSPVIYLQMVCISQLVIDSCR